MGFDVAKLLLHISRTKSKMKQKKEQAQTYQKSEAEKILTDKKPRDFNQYNDYNDDELFVQSKPYCDQIHDDQCYEYHHDRIPLKTQPKFDYTVRNLKKPSKYRNKSINVELYNQNMIDPYNKSRNLIQQSTKQKKFVTDKLLNQDDYWYNSGQYQHKPIIPVQPWSGNPYSPLINQDVPLYIQQWQQQQKLQREQNVVYRQPYHNNFIY